jgi:hypothetical protein
MLILPIQNHMQERARGRYGDARTGKSSEQQLGIDDGIFFGMIQKCTKISVAVTLRP